ncbi:MAG: helix-turn-helix transcriptional regulator [Acidimicrobiia bacterium]
MHQLEPLFSAKDLAEFLHVPIATIYAWRYRGEGPPGFRVGRHLRYRWSDVADWVSSQLERSGRRPDAAAPARARVASRRDTSVARNTDGE